MTDKIKTIITAFSSLIVYSSLCSALSYIFTNPADIIYVKLVAKIIVIIIGGLYMGTVLQNVITFDKPERVFHIKTFITLILFVFTSLFTSHFLINTMNTTIDTDIELTFLSVFISVILSPLAEEIIFRGFMYRQLAVLNKPIAFILSSVCFALYHGTLIHIYSAFLGGLIFACIYEKTKRLRYSILAHSLFNILTLFLRYVDWPLLFSSIVFIIILNIACIGSMFILLTSKSVLAIESKRKKDILN